jgi:hydrophobe/amphiphile efflux-1 (HAE1) family protein
MNLSRFFIERPVFAAMLSAIILLAGLIALPRLPISEYPEVVPPTVVVHASYPGASPSTIAETVASPLEQAITGVEDMLYQYSQATSDGAMTLTITFKLGTDVDKAQVQVQNRVAQALPKLPQEVQRLGVTTNKASPDITLAVFVYSPDGRYDQTYLANFVALRIKDELSRLDGIGDVQRFGGGDYSMRVWLDPEKIAARGMTAGDVVAAIREQNVQVAAGQLGAPPAANAANFQLAINTKGRLVDESDFENIIVKTGDGGAIVRLRDVARVELGSDNYALRAMLDNRTAVAIPIFQRPGSNAIAISDAVRAKMAELKKSFPEGIDYNIAYDPTIFVRGSIKAVVHTLLEAIVLVVIVVIVFLQTWRASIIPLLAVPVSLIGTFGVMYLFGFGLNALSLFGLVLAIGIVVDDAIVVVENVERNISEGLAPMAATRQAMKEVTGPIVATALVLSGVRTDGLHQRTFGAVLQAICTHYRHQHRDLGVQFAESVPGPVGIAAQTARCAAGSVHTRAECRIWLVLPALQPLLRPRQQRLRGHGGPRAARWFDRLVHLWRPDRPDLARLCAHTHRLCARAGQAIPDRLCAAARCRHARSHRSGDRPHEPDRAGHAWRRVGAGLSGAVHQRLHQCAQCRYRLHAAQAL